VTNEQRECIREAARHYVSGQAPVPPIAVLERVGRIVLQARTLRGSRAIANQTGDHSRSEVAYGRLPQVTAARMTAKISKRLSGLSLHRRIGPDRLSSCNRIDFRQRQPKIGTCKPKTCRLTVAWTHAVLVSSRTYVRLETGRRCCSVMTQEGGKNATARARLMAIGPGTPLLPIPEETQDQAGSMLLRRRDRPSSVFRSQSAGRSGETR
jgi:hypothetical protein